MPAGRPTKEFDKKAFADLIGFGCSQDEICWFFRDRDTGKPANPDTLSRWCKRTYGLNFQEWRSGPANSQHFSWGHTPFLIWLGWLESNQRIRGSKPLALPLGYTPILVLKVGLEPTRLAATDFESAVSAYSIHFSI